MRQNSSSCFSERIQTQITSNNLLTSYNNILKNRGEEGEKTFMEKTLPFDSEKFYKDLLVFT